MFFSFKMEAAMVAKYGSKRAIFLTGRTILCFFSNFIPTSVAKFGAWDNLNRTVRAKSHGSQC